MRELLEKNAARQILNRPVRQHFLCTGKADCAQWGATAHPGQSHNIERKRKMLLRQACSNFAAILQNPPFPRGRRYRRVFAALILEYSSAPDARKARFARRQARPFGSLSGRFPRKNAPRPCPPEKPPILQNSSKTSPRSLADYVGRVRGNKEDSPNGSK